MTGPLFHRTYYHANSILEAWLIVAKPTSLLQILFHALISRSILLIVKSLGINLMVTQMRNLYQGQITLGLYM